MVPSFIKRFTSLFLLVLIGAGGCSRPPDLAVGTPLPSVPVQVTNVALTIAPRTQPLAGTVSPLEDSTRLRVGVQVPESLPLLAIGTTLKVLVGGKVLPGRLSQLSPLLDPGSRTRFAQIELTPSDAVGPGQDVRVLWHAGKHAALMVPANAIQVVGQAEHLFVITARHARLRVVTTGLGEGPWIEVTSGLEAGEIIVVNPSVNLRDGSPVEITP